MKLTNYLLASLMMCIFPNVVGYGVSITFNQGKADSTKSCTAQEWQFVNTTLQDLKFRRERNLRSDATQDIEDVGFPEDQGHRALQTACGAYCIYVGGKRSTRREQETGGAAVKEIGHDRKLTWSQNQCVKAQNDLINRINSHVMPGLSTASPHLCRNMLQSQHTLKCFY